MLLLLPERKKQSWCVQTFNLDDPRDKWATKYIRQDSVYSALSLPHENVTSGNNFNFFLFWLFKVFQIHNYFDCQIRLFGNWLLYADDHFSQPVSQLVNKLKFIDLSINTNWYAWKHQNYYHQLSWWFYVNLIWIWMYISILISYNTYSVRYTYQWIFICFNKSRLM